MVSFSIDSMGDGINGDRAAMQALCVKVARHVLSGWDGLDIEVSTRPGECESDDERALLGAVWSACCDAESDAEAMRLAAQRFQPAEAA